MGGEWPQRTLSISALLLLSSIILFYPVQQAWTDSENGELTLSFLLVSILPFVAAMGVLAAVGYVVLNDVDTSHVRSATAWAWGAVIFSWLMHEYIIFAQELDGAVDHRLNMVTTVATWAMIGLAIGSYRSYRAEQQQVLETERDRFSSLFENTTDAVVEASVGPAGQFQVTRTNQTYAKLFERSPTALFEEAVPNEGDYAFEALREHVTSGETYTAEIQVEDGTDTRYFSLNTVESGPDRSFISLTDVTEREKRKQLLEQRGDRLEREKTAREEDLEERTNQLEFLHSLLRHNVQNGVMIIRSRAQFIADHVDDRLEQYAETIVSRSEDISEQTNRMRTMIETLAGEERPTKPVALRDVLPHRVETVDASYPSAEVAIEGSVPDVSVEADEMLDNVVDNLLQNGVKHNDSEQPEVTLRANERADGVRIEVADNGPGIPEQRRDEVFRRGVSSGTESSDSGSGFGLFFVDLMVEAYDGEVRVEHREPRGTRFVLELNKAAPEPFGEEAANRQDQPTHSE